MHAFGSSTLSLPAHNAQAESKSKAKDKFLRRISKMRAPSHPLSRSSSTNAASRYPATLPVSPHEDYSSRRAFDLFSTPSRSTVDAYASMPSSPKKSAKEVRDGRPLRRSGSSSRSRSEAATTPQGEDVPPMPRIPGVFLISDEVFIIANPRKAAPVSAPRVSESESEASSAAETSPALSFESFSAPRMSKSFSTPNTSPRPSSLSSDSLRSAASWLEDLASMSPSSDFAAMFPGTAAQLSESAETSTSCRTSLDDIDDQMLLNLCEFPPLPYREFRATASESGHATLKPPMGHRRSASHQMAQPLPEAPGPFDRSHSRTSSVPESLGPLPPQPVEAPTEAILRRTSQIKKHYSKQSSSPMIGSPMLGTTDTTGFSSPRVAPVTPSAHSVAKLLSLEAGLSLDSKLAKRNHKRTVSKNSGRKSSEISFTLPKATKLTPGHCATPNGNEEARELVSRWSEDSDPGEARRLFSLISPVLESVAKMPPFFTSSSSTGTELSRKVSPSNAISGTQTPEMLASSSISTSSSCSDLSEITSVNAEETVFDLSRPSLDYRTVYAMAQQYAQSSSSDGSRNSTDVSKLAKKLPSLPRGLDKKEAVALSLNRRNKAQRHHADPLDRTYHLART